MMQAIERLFRQREWAILALLVLTLLAVGIVNPAFLAPGNLRDMLADTARTVIVVCGMTFIIVLGEIDISVGSLMSLLAILLGQLTSPTHAALPLAVGIGLVFLLGAAVGLLNGLLVTYGRMPSIIVTLGMLTILQGVSLVLMNGQWITDLPPHLLFLGIGTLLGVPLSLWVAAVVVALAVLLARDTPLGRRLYAAGSNPEAARLAGLPTNVLKVFAFLVTGLLTAVATVVYAPKQGVIEPGLGLNFELLVVTCVVVGGTSISGGRGTIAGSVLAALLLGVVSHMLIFLHLGIAATYWSQAIQGVFILTAVLVDQASRRPRWRGRA